MSDRAQEKRVCFDFDIAFSNGGGIQGQDFRLDIDGDEISDADLGQYIIRDLRLLMVGSVKILNKRIIAERHKRSAKAHVKAGTNEAKVIDLSHLVRSGEVCYPDLPAPIFTERLTHEQSADRYAEGVTFQISHMQMVANTGTAIDSPYHRFPDGKDIGALALTKLADLDAVVIRLHGIRQRAITAELLSAVDVSRKAVLLDTGWSKLWGTEMYLRDSPYLADCGASYLVQNGATLVGIDALNIDNTDDLNRPAHSILLAADIVIVENLAALDKLPSENLRFTAAPLFFSGIGACPVRAWARVVRD